MVIAQKNAGVNREVNKNFKETATLFEKVLEE